MKFIFSITLIIISQVCFSQTISSELNGIETDIELLVKKYNAVGLSVAVVKGNKTIYSKGFGFRDLEQKLPVTPNTVFAIGSLTKSFTGSILGILESNQTLSLKDRPSLYVPNFQFYNEKMDNLIAIEDLLSHRSGIGSQGTTETFFPDDDKLKVVQRLRYLKPEADIKNSYEYSNIAYTLAGTIIEQTTKRSWELNIRQKLFDPLRMTSSYTSLEEMKQTGDFSFGYGMYKGHVERVEYENFYSMSPAGVIKSTVNDLTHWIHVWLNNGSFNGDQVIPKEYINKARSLQNMKIENYDKDNFLMGEGFGWRLRTHNGHYRMRHGGNTAGFSSLVDMYPFQGIGIVVLTNQDDSWLPYMVSDLISKRLLGLPKENEYPVIIDDIYKPSTKDKPLNANQMPLHPLKSFIGIYTAKGFGTIEIVEDGDKLFALLPTFKFKLEHLNYNSFYLKGTREFKGTFSPQFTIKFVDSISGEIGALEIIGSQKEPVIFKRQ